MTDVGALLAATVERLTRAGVPEPRADAEVLFAAALGTSRAGVVAAARQPCDPGVRARVEEAVRRRERREPVGYILGTWEFWSMSLDVDARVLIPRPETEVVVETALRVGHGARRVLDVGTGSGAIALARAREWPAATVVAVDREPGALAVAVGNARRLGLAVPLVRGDLVAAFGAGAFDLVVSNPPYVADGDLAGLEPEVGVFEPRSALAGGLDGLDVWRALVREVPRVLVPGGWLVGEFGHGQATALAEAARTCDFWDDISIIRDLAGIERVLAARRRDEGKGRDARCARS